MKFVQEGTAKETSRTRAGMDLGCAILKYHGFLDDSVSVPNNYKNMARVAGGFSLLFLKADVVMGRIKSCYYTVEQNVRRC